MVDKISVTILTKNSQRYLVRCLNALTQFNEVLIVDNGSSDATLDIATGYPNVRILEHEFTGFGPLKNFAIKEAKNDWIFSVDSDEIVTPELISSIKKLDVKNRENIFIVKRLNHYRQKPIKCCGWFPDEVMRLFNRKFTSFNDAMVHESLIVPDKAEIVKLEGKLLHYPFDSIESLIAKMQSYSTLYAKGSDKPSSPTKAFFRATFAFFRNYLLQRGFLCGYEGLLISVSNATGVFYKYMKLYEKQHKKANH